jgi:hypothetical protein
MSCHLPPPKPGPTNDWLEYQIGELILANLRVDHDCDGVRFNYNSTLDAARAIIDLMLPSHD